MGSAWFIASSFHEEKLILMVANWPHVGGRGLKVLKKGKDSEFFT